MHKHKLLIISALIVVILAAFLVSVQTDTAHTNSKEFDPSKDMVVDAFPVDRTTSKLISENYKRKKDFYRIKSIALDIKIEEKALLSEDEIASVFRNEFQNSEEAFVKNVSFNTIQEHNDDDVLAIHLRDTNQATQNEGIVFELRAERDGVMVDDPKTFDSQDYHMEGYSLKQDAENAIKAIARNVRAKISKALNEG